MTIVRMTRQGLYAQDEIIFAGADDIDTDAEFVLLMRFALCNTLDFGRMDAVHLAGIGPLLLMDSTRDR